MTIAKTALVPITALILSACARIDGPDVTASPKGPIPGKDGGQYSLFYAAYDQAHAYAEGTYTARPPNLSPLSPTPEQIAAAKAITDAQKASDDAADALAAATKKAANTAATLAQLKSAAPPDDPGTIAYKHMAIEGFGVVRANCSAFFASLGKQQRYGTLGNDAFVIAGAATTAAVGLLNPGSAAVPIIAIATAAGPTLVGGLTTFQKDFLFGSDNLDATRTLVMNALDAFTTAAMKKPAPWTFQQAANAILDNQSICQAASILSLVKGSLTNATVVATTSKGTAAGSGSGSSGKTDATSMPTGVKVVSAE